MPLSPILLLAACGTVGLDPKAGDGGAGDTGAAAPVRIDALDPDAAPLAGGTEVLVRGAGFEGEVAFWFGGTEVEVTVLGDDELAVTTPEVHAEGTVDVRVRSDLGEATLADAFTFTDAAGDGGAGDGGSGDGGSGDGGAEGLVSGLVELDYIAVGCPSCFGLTTNLLVDGSAVFHAPTATGWADWMPPAGSCAVDPARTTPTSSFEDVGGHVYLEMGSSVSIDLQRQGDASYLSSGLGSDDYVKNAAYDLSVPDGGDLGPFATEGVIQTATSITSLEPIALFADGSGAFSPLSASAASFSWAPSGTGLDMVIDIVVFNAAGTTQKGEIFCVSDDTGSATVPASAFSSFASGDLAAVYVYRYGYSTATNPVDGSTIEGATAFGALGTATLRP